MSTASEAIFSNACKVIPGGVNSPVRSFRSVGMKPMIVASGKGDMIRDVDGREFIDYCGSWGPLILGHAHPQIVRAAQQQIAMGASFGISTEIEEKLATKIVQLVPSVEKIRFVSSGTEATMTALRMARGFRGRTKIVKFAGHYHGHHDSLLVQAGSGVASLNSEATSLGVNPGVIADTISLPFNDEERVRSFLQGEEGARIAAIIVEPIAGNMGVVLPEEGFLEMLREESRRCGALLIFDEVITGFRVGLQGAQGLFGIDPDMTCFGKVIGAGFPVAAVGGKREIMDVLAPIGQVYQAGTLSGNPVAMRAGLETLQLLEKNHFYPLLEEKAKRLVAPIEKALEKTGAIACLQRCGSMLTLFFGVKKVRCKEDLRNLDEAKFKRFFKFLFDQGIYIPPASQEAWFISSAHTDEHLDFTADSICSFINN
jgi:glutamate-1-semialdehyde 2,1-aminomutase